MTEENDDVGVDVSIDDNVLSFGQSMRHDLVVNMTTDSGGKKRLPHDPESVNAIRGLLKDSDSSVFTKRRVMTEEASAENDKRAADILERVLDGAHRSTRDATEYVSGRDGPNMDASRLPKFDIEAGAVSDVGDVVDLDDIIKKGRQVRKGEV